MRLTQLAEFTDMIVPSGSFVATVINDNGSYTLKKVTLDKLGATGPSGAAGSAGTSIHSGNGAPAAGLGNTGDQYINTANGALYSKSTGVWVLSGNLTGPTGATGPAGPAGPGSTPGGNNTYVQFNDSSAFGGDSAFTYDKTNDELSVDNVKLGVKTETYNANVTIDFREQGFRILDLTGDLTLASSNLASGRAVTIKILCDGTPRNLTFPGGWIFVGTEPTQIGANKTGILSLTAFGNADANVIAAWGVEA